MTLSKEAQHLDRLIASIEKNTKAIELLEYRIYIVSVIGTIGTIIWTAILIAGFIEL
jgi:hypothetical protein